MLILKEYAKGHFSKGVELVNGLAHDTIEEWPRKNVSDLVMVASMIASMVASIKAGISSNAPPSLPAAGSRSHMVRQSEEKFDAVPSKHVRYGIHVQCCGESVVQCKSQIMIGTVCNPCTWLLQPHQTMCQLNFYKLYTPSAVDQ